MTTKQRRQRRASSSSSYPGGVPGGVHVRAGPDAGASDVDAMIGKVITTPASNAIIAARTPATRAPTATLTAPAPIITRITAIGVPAITSAPTPTTLIVTAHAAIAMGITKGHRTVTAADATFKPARIMTPSGINGVAVSLVTSGGVGGRGIHEVEAVAITTSLQ